MLFVKSAIEDYYYMVGGGFHPCLCGATCGGMRKLF